MRFYKRREFEKTPRWVVVVAAYLNAAPLIAGPGIRCLVNSLLAQLIPPAEIVIVHDGKIDHENNITDVLSLSNTIRLIETPERRNDFGHSWRQYGLDRVTTEFDWLTLTNQDNYYVPVFSEWLISEALKNNATLAYCDCIHSHYMWQKLTTMPRRGRLDLGGFIVAKSLAVRCEFNDTCFAADGLWINRLMQQPNAKAIKVDATLFVHN